MQRSRVLFNGPVIARNTQNSYKDQSKRQLGKLADKEKNILFQTKTAFPLDLFPDKVTVEREKVTVINKEFFGSGRIQSFLIENISDVSVDVSLWFATLRMIDKFYESNIIEVKNLPRKDAIKIRRLVQGLILCNRRKIDISGIESNELIQLLEEVGSVT